MGQLGPMGQMGLMGLVGQLTLLALHGCGQAPVTVYARASWFSAFLGMASRSTKSHEEPKGLRMHPTLRFNHTNGSHAQRFRCPWLREENPVKKQ